MPAINQAVIVYLVDFLRDLSRQENSSVTKMDADNLAMIFAPLFLRCPDSSLLFSNSVYEATFVQNLLTSDPNPAIYSTNSIFRPPSIPPTGVTAPSPRMRHTSRSFISPTSSILSSITVPSPYSALPFSGPRAPNPSPLSSPTITSSPLQTRLQAASPRPVSSSNEVYLPPDIRASLLTTEETS